MSHRIRLIQGDITQLEVDAIVNAANTSLLGGGGVDGAIHRAAGPDLLEACKDLNGCRTGHAKLTKGFRLPAKYVIHTVGPVWKGGQKNEAELLELCYRMSLELASIHQLKTIAFPNISTGVYGFPKQLAAEIAIRIVQRFLRAPGSIEKVTFVVFDEDNFLIYNKALS